jgi:glutamate-5-semialdehyde dehydrogenase
MRAMNAEPEMFTKAVAEACAAARAAAAILASARAGVRDQALLAAARHLRADATKILDANARDMSGFSGTAAFADRLRLTHERIEAMARGLEDIAALPDPLAGTLAQWTRPNGLVITRIPQPLGVLGMIFESRPNVAADAAAIALKAGNALLLRGGSESFFSVAAIHAAIAAGLREAGLPAACVQVAPTTERAFVGAMLAAAGQIDLMIPRGGKALVERVQREARIPVLAHAEGLNHTYIHAAADFDMAEAILVNAKLRRTGICGATETLLLDAAIADALLPRLIATLAAQNCDFRADERARAIVPALPAAGPDDFDTEWLDAILNIRIVDGLNDALAHIAAHGSEHTDAIVTQDEAAAQTFLAGVASAVALWNASTQFCDGGEFGFGAEIGIATGRIHARGPIGPAQLTTFRYLVRGTGQVRP